MTKSLIKYYYSNEWAKIDVLQLLIVAGNRTLLIRPEWLLYFKETKFNSLTNITRTVLKYR